MAQVRVSGEKEGGEAFSGRRQKFSQSVTVWQEVLGSALGSGVGGEPVAGAGNCGAQTCQ